MEQIKTRDSYSNRSQGNHKHPLGNVLGSTGVVRKREKHPRFICDSNVTRSPAFLCGAFSRLSLDWQTQGCHHSHLAQTPWGPPFEVLPGTDVLSEVGTPPPPPFPEARGPLTGLKGALEKSQLLEMKRAQGTVLKSRLAKPGELQPQLSFHRVRRALSSHTRVALGSQTPTRWSCTVLPAV